MQRIGVKLYSLCSVDYASAQLFSRAVFRLLLPSSEHSNLKRVLRQHLAAAAAAFCKGTISWADGTCCGLLPQRGRRHANQLMWRLSISLWMSGPLQANQQRPGRSQPDTWALWVHARLAGSVSQAAAVADCRLVCLCMSLP